MSDLAHAMRPAALGVAAWLAASPASAQLTGDPRSGEQIAAETCAECHAAVGAGRAPAFVTIAGLPSTTEATLTTFLQTSHASMPDLILSLQDRADVIAYIMSLRP